MENPLDFKKKLFDYCSFIQKNKINDLRLLVDETQQSANEYGPPKDRYDSFRSQLLRKRDMYAQQLEIMISEQNILKNIDINKVYTNICLGAFVVTNSQKIFVAIGLGKITFENDTIFVISTNVPFYNSIKGKIKGEEIVFNEKHFKIINVF